MMDQEPISLVIVVQALIALGVAFGLDLTVEQTAAIVAVAGIVGMLIARRFVWSQRSVEKVTGLTIENAQKRLDSKS